MRLHDWRIVAVGLVALLANRYIYILDIGKELSAATQSCTLLAPDVLPVEDLVAFSQGVAIGGAGSTIPCMEHSPESQPEGYMVAVDLRSGKPVVKKLKITGLPDKQFSFHPHGIFYSTTSKRLYVVNHSGTTRSGTRVEVFSVKEGSDGLPELTWRTAIGGPGVFPNVGMNSVVEGANPEEIYVTQFQNWDMPATGSKGPNQSLSDRLGRAIHDIVELAGVQGFTGIHRCTYDISTNQVSKNCKWAAKGFVHANGLTISEDRTKLYVNEPVRKEVRVFERESNGELHELRSERMILPHSVDNIHVQSNGEIHAGSITRIWQILAHKPVEGTLLVGVPQVSGGYSWSDAMVHDASLMDQIATCMRLHAPGTGAYALCGSPKSNGVLACKL